MAVFRVEKTRDYTVMANHHLKNKELSLKAKGLLSQMLSLPEDWDYTLKGLSMINRENVDAIREAVKELERAGYIARSRGRNDKGQLMGSDYTIFERPKVSDEFPEGQKPILENPMLVKPIQENAMLGSPALGNPTQLITNRSSPNLLEKNKANKNQENPYPFTSELAETGMNGWDRTENDEAFNVREAIKENIEYVCIIQRFNCERLDEIVDLIVETLCSQKPYINVAGDDYPASLVKDKLLRLNSSHIAYVFECLDKNTTYIRNIKKYLLTTLFNAPSTIGSYYTALVNHDLYGK